MPDDGRNSILSSTLHAVDSWTSKAWVAVLLSAATTIALVLTVVGGSDSDVTSLAAGSSCSVDTGRALAVAGLHPASGGDGTLLCSGDMLLQALAACAGVTLRAVATSIGVELRGGTVHVEGDLDFRGTLGVDKQASVGFTAVRTTFDLDSDATDDEMATLLRLTERYCVVYQTLARPPSLAMSRDLV